jgi:hypothetical protein
MEVQQKPFTKKKPSQLVYLELGSSNGGMLISLSEEGFRFRAVSPVRPDVEMRFAFQLDGSVPLEGAGVIEDLDDDCKSGALRFTEVSEQFRSSLNGWLKADTSSSYPGREFTSAASDPLDTMEKIRKDLRAGYGKPVYAPDPVPSVLPLTQPSTEPGIAVSAASAVTTESTAPAVEAKASEPSPPLLEAESGLAARPAAIPQEAKVAFPTTADLRAPVPGTSTLRLPQPKPEAADTESVRRLFSAELSADASNAKALDETTIPAEKPTPEPTEITSAFLRSTGPEYHTPFMPRRAVMNPTEQTEKVRADSKPRPYVPPLEESFDQAWERARIVTSPDSPHMSRTAAGGIITVALAVILGALAFNFRQEIGTGFISLGRSISGGSQATPSQAAPDAQPAGGESDSGATEAQPNAAPSDAPSQLDSAAKPSPSKPGGAVQNFQAAAGPSVSTPASQPATNARESAATKSPKSEPSSSATNGKPGNTAPPQPAPETASNPGEVIETVTGEGEFNAARNMLQGPNRLTELRRAVDLLWASVRKGYVPAEVTLADLYRRGDGVEKNCDQAIVLLTAASKKGSADARRMLELLAEQGCR